MQYNVPKHIKGLTTEELKTSRKKFGFNQIDAIKKMRGIGCCSIF